MEKEVIKKKLKILLIVWMITCVVFTLYAISQSQWYINGRHIHNMWNLTAGISMFVSGASLALCIRVLFFEKKD